MAEAPKPQRLRRRRRQTSETKVEVKVSENEKPLIPGVAAKRRRRNRRRRPVFGPWLPGQGPRRRTRLRRAIKREIKKEGLDGPRVSVQQRVSSTFGLVGPNKSGNVELELNFFLHPSLAKEANDGTSFGPVQALAAQYALWKLKHLKLIFTPMVGASAVSGTVIRASLNLSQSPGGTNWSGLGTRVHLDIHPGQTAVFNLRGDQIGGPRDGGWWLTDTNEEGSQSAGPIIEVHTLGKTESTFQSNDWTGPLFIVEGIGVWQFANYQVKPALGMLERKQDTVNVTMNATAGEPITMELPLNSSVAQFMMNAEPEAFAVPSTSSVGETIFQMVDVGADLASKFTPPPFSWLIKGGWWFLKRVFGKQKEGMAVFNVYPSLADAQNDRPAIAGATATYTDTTVNNAEIMVTQINSPNVGPQPTSSANLRALVPTPMPLGLFRMHTEMYPMEMVAWSGPDDPFYPNSYIVGKVHANGDTHYLKTAWYVALDSGEAKTTAVPSNLGGYIHTMYRLENPRFASLDGTREYLPPVSKTGVSVYFGGPINAGNVYNKIGDVVATAHISAGGGTSDVGFLGMLFTLIKATKTQPGTAQERDLQIIWAQQAGNDPGKRDKIEFTNFNAVGSGKTPSVRTMDFAKDQYLLGVSFGVGNSTYHGGFSKIQGTNVEVAVNFPVKTIPGAGTITDAFYRIDGIQGAVLQKRVVPYGLSGNMFATFSTDLNLIYVDTPELDTNLLEKLQQLGVSFSMPPAQVSTPEYLKDFLFLLAEEGRLPTRSEIALRKGDFQEALRLYQEM